MKQSRRDFIRSASALSAGAMISPQLLSGPKLPDAGPDPICVFTKCLQFLDYPELGETLAAVGFSGADLSVRNGGHVLPENVKTDLPRAVKALRKAGVSVPMMVTGITGTEDPHTEALIAAAADLGIGYYRMGYMSYDPEKSLPDSLDAHKKRFEKLEKLNRKYGICGCYQNHSGPRVGGPVWDLHRLVDGFDPEYIGIQYDIRHAVAEGGLSWPLGMKLLAPWIRNTAIKDFIWKEVEGKWKIYNVPLGEGMIEYDAYLEEYVDLGISGPVTIHYEYELGGAEKGSRNPTMSLEDISEFMITDLKWLKDKFDKYKIKYI